MSDIAGLLIDGPILRAFASEAPSWWQLGSLCRYESRAHRENSWDPVEIDLHLKHYQIIRKTPKGCWIDVHGEKKFVLDGARKRWAYPTEELAMESFIARKRWQVSHLQWQLMHAQAALTHAEAMTKAAA